MALIEYAPGMKTQFTATGYVVSQDRSRMLMIFHGGLQRWLPPGGHVDPDEFPVDTACVRSSRRPAPRPATPENTLWTWGSTSPRSLPHAAPSTDKKTGGALNLPLKRAPPETVGASAPFSSYLRFT